MTLSPFSTGCSLSSHLGPSLSLLFSFHPSFLPPSAPSPRLPLPSRAGTAQQPGLDVWTCLRTEHYSMAELNAGSRPRYPALEASAAIVIGHMGFGVCISVSFAWSFGLVPAHTESDYGLLGTDNISIKSLYILQQRRSRSSLPWSSRSSAAICCQLVHLTILICMSEKTNEHLNNWCSILDFCTFICAALWVNNDREQYGLYLCLYVNGFPHTTHTYIYSPGVHRHSCSL